MFIAMWNIIVIITVFSALSGGLAVQLPCNSQLRTILPHLFTHCGSCNYSPWGSWKVVNRAASTQCPSKRAFTQTRTRYDYNKVCENKTETRHTCKYLQIVITNNHSN